MGKVRERAIFLYIICLLLPLLITDGTVIYVITGADKNARIQESRAIADSVKYNFVSEYNAAEIISKKIATNEFINNLLNKEYASDLSYYSAWYNFMKDYSLLQTGMSYKNAHISLYADNPTIQNGGKLYKLENVLNEAWYKSLKASGKDSAICVYYDQKSPVPNTGRKISILRRLNYFHDGCEKILKFDLDYNDMVENVLNNNYNFKFYLCSRDFIILSNDEAALSSYDFAKVSDFNLTQGASELDFTLNDEKFSIYINDGDFLIGSLMKKELPLFIILFIVNILLPLIFAQIISILYANKLRERESDLARINAELLALHSQINPHFLFNSLETIRMSSVLKKEDVTAEMVENLATIYRQYVYWGTDAISIREEIKIVNAYIKLQRYRFGTRLQYKAEISPECLDFIIPKLTIVTFMENACVHGVENKSAAVWVFLRIYKVSDELIIEVEDTGKGVEPEKLADLRAKTQINDIDALKAQRGIGIANASLRLHMFSAGMAKIEIESEENIGTMVTITIPLNI